MRAVIIGAGRGSRLEHRTDHVPKTLVEVLGRPMLDWILEALTVAGFTRDSIVFVSGYAEEVVRDRYPDLQFVRNDEWADNNILASLMCARDYFSEGFLSTYADIVYEPAVVRRLVEAPHDFALGCDTRWLSRYTKRSRHPSSDAEKLRLEGDRVIEVGRRIPDEAAAGEFIGVMKVTAQGAQQLSEAYTQAHKQFGEGAFREGRSLRKAYLIDLLQSMLLEGTVMHHADTDGGYMEIDTLEDLALAQEWYAHWP